MAEKQEIKDKETTPEVTKPQQKEEAKQPVPPQQVMKKRIFAVHTDGKDFDVIQNEVNRLELNALGHKILEWTR